MTRKTKDYLSVIIPSAIIFLLSFIFIFYSAMTIIEHIQVCLKN